MTRRILVPGAGGFIGSHLVRRLANEGHGADLKRSEVSASAAHRFTLAPRHAAPGRARKTCAWVESQVSALAA